MDYKRILTIQDISCVGQCSITVALPVLSACGHETAVLPSAVLSTHTTGFDGYTLRDLSGDMPAIENHWVNTGITFDAVYTGYLGSAKQVDYVLSIISRCMKENGTAFIDPAMADNGKLYPGFDDTYVQAMVRLCKGADYILPNITEACFLAGVEYRTEYDRAYIDLLLEKQLEDGNFAYAFFNFGETKQQVIAKFEAKAELRDAWAKEDLDPCQYLHLEMMPHTVRIIKSTQKMALVTNAVEIIEVPTEPVIVDTDA